jgi:uncharacterized tellurite resistance protein B-like protein
MGLFDKLLGNEAKLTPKSAFVLAALTLIAADGQIDEEEIFALRRLVKGDTDAIKTAQKVWQATPNFKELLPIIAAALDAKQREVVIANLIDLAMADGTLAYAEKELLGLYLQAFQISEETVKPIIDVVALKNNSSVF